MEGFCYFRPEFAQNESCVATMTDGANNNSEFRRYACYIILARFYSTRVLWLPAAVCCSTTPDMRIKQDHTRIIMIVEVYDSVNVLAAICNWYVLWHRYLPCNHDNNY